MDKRRVRKKTHRTNQKRQTINSRRAALLISKRKKEIRETKRGSKVPIINKNRLSRSLKLRRRRCSELRTLLRMTPFCR